MKVATEAVRIAKSFTDPWTVEDVSKQVVLLFPQFSPIAVRYSIGRALAAYRKRGRILTISKGGNKTPGTYLWAKE
jgi:hypothetical protein